MTNARDVPVGSDTVGGKRRARVSRSSTVASLVIVLLSWAICQAWFPDSIWGRLGAFFLLVVGAPPITVVVVEVIADRFSAGNVRRADRIPSTPKPPYPDTE